MAIKGQIEAIIYAAEDPVTLDQIALVLKQSVIAENGLADADLEASALDAEVKKRVREAIEELTADYANSDRGMEVRQVAGGFRMGTKPEHHEVVRHFAKNLKPPVRLSLPALETLAVIAYKQPVTAPEISEIRGVDSSGVLATLLDRKLITTAGRKQVVGRPILYKTSKDFLLRFGLKDVGELPSLEEFEKLAGEGQGDLFQPAAPSDAPAENQAPVIPNEPGAPLAGETEEPCISSADADTTSLPDSRERAETVQAEPAAEPPQAPGTPENQS